MVGNNLVSRSVSRICSSNSSYCSRIKCFMMMIYQRRRQQLLVILVSLWKCNCRQTCLSATDCCVSVHIGFLLSFAQSLKAKNYRSDSF